ncbi:ethanolamine ammonia-lyase subunit EutC [Falsiroseomonas oryzae]|uniref:ethanolamine ammonia-lyase subunit EutC n=1 Tax=Falsiroseomonas oryzae TaxID=2766473 RepID=UPI0022EB206C|nr:ethanolamine ammonia-lyase subunit EutC [Roseomonas sp. MO-31]
MSGGADEPGSGRAEVGPPLLWRDLRRFTTARVGLGRVGHAQPTSAHLDFQEAHARARDAVWSALDSTALASSLEAFGVATRQVASEAADRRTYLLRPDLGRRLAAADREVLAADSRPGCLALVVADGLCASGVQTQAAELVAHLLPALGASGWDLAPVVLASQARVALGDDVGEVLGAVAVAVMIGERPGLSAIDSVGIYLTWAPHRGRTDAERNCISNIRPAGLRPADAARKLLWLLAAARRLGATGVALKDDESVALEGTASPTIDAMQR